MRSIVDESKNMTINIPGNISIDISDITELKGFSDAMDRVVKLSNCMTTASLAILAFFFTTLLQIRLKTMLDMKFLALLPIVLLCISIFIGCYFKFRTEFFKFSTEYIKGVKGLSIVFQRFSRELKLEEQVNHIFGKFMQLLQEPFTDARKWAAQHNIGRAIIIQFLAMTSGIVFSTIYLVVHLLVK
jgi:hypothetical protein